LKKMPSHLARGEQLIPESGFAHYIFLVCSPLCR
jgi:hypothetical protein